MSDNAVTEPEAQALPCKSIEEIKPSKTTEAPELSTQTAATELSTTADPTDLPTLDDIFHDMITYVIYNAHQHGGITIGGFVRDYIRQANWHDIDFKFADKSQAIIFMQWLEWHFNVVSYKEKSYVKCFSLCVQHKDFPPLVVLLDLSYNEAETTGDFDVNTLAFYLVEHMTSYAIHQRNPKCWITDVMSHIEHMEFVVLDAHGFPYVSHVPGTNQCIDRSTLKGRILISRRNKMVQRGWKCLNTFCPNLNCILADPSKVITKKISKAKKKARSIDPKVVTIPNKADTKEPIKADGKTPAKFSYLDIAAKACGYETAVSEPEAPTSARQPKRNKKRNSRTKQHLKHTN